MITEKKETANFEMNKNSFKKKNDDYRDDTGKITIDSAGIKELESTLE